MARRCYSGRRTVFRVHCILNESAVDSPQSIRILTLTSHRVAAGERSESTPAGRGEVMETDRTGTGLAVLRVVVGIVFLMHGGQKLFIYGFHNVGGFMQQLGIPLPQVAGVVVTLVEFLGGLALLLGLFTRWAAVLNACDMLVAVTVVHLRGGFFLPKGFEYALTMLAASVTLALAGPGAAALDTLLGRRRAGRWWGLTCMTLSDF